MNKSNLKSYAPRARLDFIKAVTERANVLGISAAGALPAEVRGDVALIDGREWPAKVAGRRDELVARIKRHGFEQTMDEVAYTWFNRLAALRYMEIHDYLGHGWRVLSSRDGGLPEILRHASEVALPGLNPDSAREMQLAGNRDNELFKLLLVAQCNELSRVMPFLFERIDDETELLLPENLLRTDSIVAKLVEQVPEDDWQEIEVIGWLYQFYISEKKDQVIGKVVKSEDIPAATQLFTPNWIVQYLVQNSVGRLWLMCNPTSTLAGQWPYYIQPAEQTPEVQAQLDALIQTRIRESGETLNPETITVLDPACGSGHILVVAYDVMKAIYLERGYQPRTIPRLILEKNLFGLDIDDRAGQLAAFSLLMKARADDRRLFVDPPKLNVLSLQESGGLNADELATHLEPFGVQRSALSALVEVFKDAKTFGSLIRIPSELSAQVAAVAKGVGQALHEGDLYARQAAKDVAPLVWQASLLSLKFDAVAANPPYMGSNGMSQQLKEFGRRNFADGRTDLYGMFMLRGMEFSRECGLVSFVTMKNWMFLQSFEALRERCLNKCRLESLVHVGFNSFPEMNSKVAQACCFSLGGHSLNGYAGTFVDLNDAPQSADKGAAFQYRSGRSDYIRSTDYFDAIPGSPLAFWITERFRSVFLATNRVGDFAPTKIGMRTGDNGRFLRYWHEVSLGNACLSADGAEAFAQAGRRWAPYNKGGDFRKWYGNHEYFVNWCNNGEDIKKNTLIKYPQLSPENLGWKISNERFYFRPGLTWSDVTSARNAFRFIPKGFIFDGRGSSAFADSQEHALALLGYLNSEVVYQLLSVVNPSLTINVGDVAGLPAIQGAIEDEATIARVARAIEISKQDWDSAEISWNFQRPTLLAVAETSLKSAWESASLVRLNAFEELRRIEEANNLHFAAAFGLTEEITSTCPDEQITISKPDRGADSRQLVSYALGCAMGRYSLDEPSLIYAHSGNIGFDPNRYSRKFPADVDAIIPITNDHWFEDDAFTRIREFLLAVWGGETLESNMTWLAESLGTKGGESPDEAVRRYLSDRFFKDHLQTYKKRPIYWLFSSGKQGAFQGLVYLHRYNDGTLARMRAEYVVPLIAKMASRLDMLDKDVAAASSAAARTKLQKQIEALRKKQIELLAYDEKLRHYADMRLTLDLDDGVKVNYAKFGDLVAESKAVTGGSDE